MAKKLMLVAFGLMIGIIMAEGVSRWFAPKDSVFWNNPMMMPYSGGTFDPKTTAESMHESSDPNRVQKYVPDVNRWYRLDPEPFVPATGNLVLNLGDSSTWGWGLVDRRNAYATVLNQLLPKDVTSINLGVPYYSSLEGLKYLQEMLPRYAERVVGVTLYFGNNDATENGSTDEATLERLSQTNGLQNELTSRFALYRLLRSVATGFQAGRPNDKVRVSPDQYEANLRAMIELCQRYGIPVVVIEPRVPLSWQPAHIKYSVSLKDRVRNPWTSAELAESEKLYQLGLEQVYRQNDSYEPLLQQAVEHDWVIPRIKSAWRNRLRAFDQMPGVKVVRLSDAWILGEYPYAFEDYCHPSTRSHDQIAVEVAKAFGW